MEINYIRDFVVLADKRNYMEAAESLFISQSSLSRHLLPARVSASQCPMTCHPSASFGLSCIRLQIIPLVSTVPLRRLAFATL